MGVEQTPNKSQHTKLTLEKKILQPLMWDSNSQPFDHESGALHHQVMPVPCASSLFARPEILIARGSGKLYFHKLRRKPTEVCPPAESICRSLATTNISVIHTHIALCSCHTGGNTLCNLLGVNLRCYTVGLVAVINYVVVFFSSSLAAVV